MNYRTMAVAIVGVLCLTGIVCFNLFVRWQTGAERCTVTTELQDKLMVLSCRATIEETFRSMDKELCSTWEAEVELEKLKKTFSRASHGEVSFRQETLDIRRTADRAIRNVAARGSEAGIDLRLVAVDEIPLVQGHREKILWALTHLLENAIKFTGSGGRVELGLKPESTNLVMISVRDTGIGIPPQHLQEIFEPFRQLDASARRRAGGTGLGLTLVRQIVEAHGSILDVNSVEG